MSNPSLYSLFKSFPKFFRNPLEKHLNSTLLSPPKAVTHSVWFPKNLKDLNRIEKSILLPGTDLKSDHKSFSDPIYSARREEISEIASSFSVLEKEIPRINYTTQEQQTWKAVFELLTPLHKKFACAEYLKNFEELRKEYGMTSENVPQLQDINEYLQQKSNFRVIPIAGMLTQRDFLSFLAFRVFTATQFIRHHSDPFYTPEPDIVHELMGHVPLLADKDFADFSQIIGLASLGASDEDIEKLGLCYLFSVEFGLLRERNEFKIYGAGILSSAQEIQNAMSGEKKTIWFDPEVAVQYECPLSDLQSVFFYSHTLGEAKNRMLQFVKNIKKGFRTSYDEVNNSIIIK